MNAPDLFPLFLAGVVLFALLRSFLGHGPRKQAAPEKPADVLPPNAILVDGSNVMHWGGDPSERVLIRVIQDLRAKGHASIVVFDASVGYRLGSRYLSGAQMAQMIGLPAAQVAVVNKGVVADEVLLDLAQTHSLRIVTNDRYRDWRVQFPVAKEKGTLVQGTWTEGNVVWRRVF